MPPFDDRLPVLGQFKVLYAAFTVVGQCPCGSSQLLALTRQSEAQECPKCGAEYALLDPPSGRIGRVSTKQSAVIQ